MREEERERRLQHLARIQIGPELTAADLTARLADCATREQDLLEAQEQADANSDDDRDDVSVPPSGQSVGASFFDDSVKSVDKARMLYYLNSGLFRFQQYKDYGEQWDGSPIDVPGLQAEVLEEGVTAEEQAEFMRDFLKQYPYTTGTLPACGACGLRIPDNGLPHASYRRLYLTDNKAALLKYTTEQAADFDLFRKSCAAQLEIPVDDDWNTTTVDLSKARSVYIEEHASGGPTFWHLHPELVEQDEHRGCSTLLCPHCTASLQLAVVPKRSIAAGVDFGFYNRLNLTLPNLQEQHIISRTRLFFATLKVSSNTCGTVNQDLQSVIKCHAVFFTDNSADTAAYMFNSNLFGRDGMLDLDSLKGMLQVAMLAPGGGRDLLFQRIYNSTLVTARAFLCAQWLLVLHSINSFYKDLDVSRIEGIKDVVGELNRHVKETTQHIVDPDIVEAAQARGSDVAGVAHVEVRPDDEGERLRQAAVLQPPGGLSGVPISYSFLADREEAYMMEDEHDFRIAALTRLAQLEDGELAHLGNTESSMSEMIFDSDAVDEYLARYPMTQNNSATRGADPLCQFGNDDQLLGTCFPHIFLFGDAYHRPVGCLNQDERYHLLNQFTVAPAEDRRLQGLLFNVKQRREVITGVRAYVDGRSGSLRALKELLEDRGERARLRNAIKAPYSHVAKRLIRKYMKHLRPAGKGVAYGAVEGTTFKHQMLGCNRRYGPVTCFLTLSPANLDNPRSIRCCFRTVSNTKFPAVFEAGCPYGANGLDFLNHMEDNYDDVTTEGVIALPRALRARKSIANPVAFVAENKRLLRCILTYLLGVSPEARGFYSKLEGPSARKTHFYRTRKGVLGHLLYCCGVTEDHSRGTLHWHLNLAAGPSAFAMQRFAHLPEMCDSLSRVLDLAYKSEVTPVLHVGTLVRKYLRRHRALRRVPNEVISALDPGSALLARGDAFRAIELGQGGGGPLPTLSPEAAVQAANQQFHDPWHVPRCHHGLAGKTGCALSMPQGCVPRTRPVLLRPLVPRAPGGADGASVDGRSEGGESTEGPSVAGAAEETDPGTMPPVAGGELPEDAPPENDTPYSAVLMSALPHPEAVPAHHLVSVLDPSLPTTVVVWETKRPIIRAAAFNVDLADVADVTAHVVSTLRTLLQGVEAFSGNAAPFWHWLENTATEADLRGLYDFVKQHLPIANGFLAAYNPGLSFATASHNNVCLLGGLGQAKNAMFYLIPYSGKNKFPLAESLPILENALQHIQAYHSTAVDSGTMPRTIKHLLTRVLNRMHLQHELSDWQVAAALLELPSTLMSDRFVYGNPLALAGLRTQLELETNRRAAFNRMCDAVAQGRQRATATFHWNSRAAQEEWAGSDLDEAPAGNVDALAAEAADRPPPYDPASVTQDLGYIKPFDIAIASGPQDASNPTRRILLPTTAQYYFRGPELERLTYEEFLAIVEFKNAKPSPKRDDPVNWKTQRQFRSNPRFVGYDSCYYVLRSKQCTPLFLGRTPGHPGTRPPLENPPVGQASAAAQARWEEAANAYARYYLNIYKPMHAYEARAPHCTMEELESWVAELQQAPSLVSQFRCIMIRQHVTGLRTSTACQDMLRQYRQRARHLWNAKERSSHAAEAACSAQQASRRRRSDVDDADEFLYREWNGREANDIRERLQHDQKQQHEFTRLSGVIPVPVQSSATVAARNKGMTPFHDCTRVQQIVHEIDQYTPGPDAALRSRNPTAAYRGAPLTRLEMQRRDARIAAIRLTLYTPTDPAAALPQQVQLLDQFIARFTGREEVVKLPQVVLLHGGPGSGKTTLRDAIMEVATLCDCRQLRVSYNHSNATEMGGQTVCSVIGNNATLYSVNVATFTKAQMQQLTDMKLSKSSLVVLEEVENNVPWGLARLSRACQFITGEWTEPFGGMNVLFIGDLTQLKSCMCPLGLTGAVMDIHLTPLLRKRATQGQRKVHLGKALLSPERPEDAKYGPLHPYTVGTGILTGAYWFELTEQQRSLDPRQTAFVTDTYKGRPVTMDKVRNQGGFRIFDETDAGREEWIKAPVLVSTNRERYSLVHLRSLCFARFYGIPVFRWLVSYRKWRNRPDPEFLSEALDDPCFYQYYVQGCRGYLTDKVCVALYLINGLEIKLHSMTFSDEHGPEMEQIILTAKPGYVYTLPQPPITVNVELLLPSHTPAHILDALAALSLEQLPVGAEGPWRIIVPLHGHIACKETKKPVLVRGGDGFGPSKVLLRSIFPYETNFALTVHRSLGVTLERGIIALSECRVRLCRFTYEQVHVAFSRFRQGSHVRLLLTGDSEADKWESIAYLQQLQQDESISFFFSGYRESTTAAPNRGWEVDAWCAARANRCFGKQLDAEQRGRAASRPPFPRPKRRRFGPLPG